MPGYIYALMWVWEGWNGRNVHRGAEEKWDETGLARVADAVCEASDDEPAAAGTGVVAGALRVGTLRESDVGPVEHRSACAVLGTLGLGDIAVVAVVAAALVDSRPLRRIS